MRRLRPAGDVGELPTVTFGPKSLMWWGTFGFIVIEGWTTALLAHLTGPSGSVVGVELVPELAEWGGANLAGTSYDWASIRTATPDVLGVPASAPYDRILVSAEATELPEALVEQLGEGGRLVIPVRGTM